MRTVSFSDHDVRKILGSHFVSTFSDTTGDPTAGESIWHSPGESPGSCIRGNGNQNVQTLFMTPAGKIYHVASGYLSPKDLARELEYARDLFAQLGEDSSSNAEVVRSAHERRLSELGFSEGEIEDGAAFGPVSLVQGGNDREASGAEDLFSGLTKLQILNDHRFSIRHPLMDLREFQEDPALLVGNGKSFFSSSSSSGTSNGE